MIYKLGILASIRSGTTYALHLYRHCNVAIGHNTLDAEGAILWDYTKRANMTQFRNCWHQTRNPLKVISSVAASANLFWRNMAEKFTEINLEDTPVKRAMEYWNLWTDGCEERTNWQYKIEDVYEASDKWLEICDRLELGPMIYPKISTKMNGKEHDDLCWEDLLNTDRELALTIKNKSKMYGY